MEIKKAIDELKYQEAMRSNGADYQVNNLVIGAAISALEKQIPKKPMMKPFYEDMEEEYLCCPNCGHILTDRIPADNKDFYFHCLNCGQKFDWSEDNG